MVGDPQIFRARFRALADLGRWDDAVRAGMDWLAAAPDSADAHVHQAWALLRCKDKDPHLAERHAREAICLAPEWNWPPRLLSHALSSQERWEEALAAAADALRIEPQDDEAHELAARCLCHLGRTAEALPHAQQAAALDPNDAEHRRFLHWLEYLDKSSAADIYNRIQKLKATLALDPTNVGIHRDLAVIYGSDLADYQTAEDFLRNAIEIAPDDLELHALRDDLQCDRDAVYRTIRVPWAFASALCGPLRRPDDFSASEVISWGVVALAAVSCCLPAAGFAFIPTKAYEWLVLTEYRAARVRWGWLSRMLYRLSRLPLGMRRMIWSPVPFLCAGLTVWLLPLPPFLTVGALVACSIGCVLFARWTTAKARANQRMLTEIVTAESADEFVLAEPANDVIRADLA